MIDYAKYLTQREIMEVINRPMTVREVVEVLTDNKKLSYCEWFSYSQKVRKALNRAVHQGYVNKFGKEVQYVRNQL